MLQVSFPGVEVCAGDDVSAFECERVLRVRASSEEAVSEWVSALQKLIGQNDAKSQHQVHSLTHSQPHVLIRV